MAHNLHREGLDPNLARFFLQLRMNFQASTKYPNLGEAFDDFNPWFECEA